MENNSLTSNQKQRIANIDMLVGSVVLLGSIGGIIYANKTGGGFWRYLGYWIVGGLVTGIPSRLVATPFKNKILKEADKSTINKSNLASKSEALQVLNLWTTKGDLNLNENQKNYFAELYSQKIDKDLHNRLMVTLNKKGEYEWNDQDRKDVAFLGDEVIRFLK